jgi:hypothetical protein
MTIKITPKIKERAKPDELELLEHYLSKNDKYNFYLVCRRINVRVWQKNNVDKCREKAMRYVRKMRLLKNITI